MAENSKTVASKQNTASPVLKFLKEYRYIILLSIITTYYLQYYIFYAFTVITYPINKAFYILYWILYNLLTVLWYIITVITITLFNTTQFLITWLFYSLYFIITFLINFVVNVITVTISLLLLVFVIAFLVTNSNSKETSKYYVKEEKKIEEPNNFRELVILPSRKKQLWKDPSNRCTCTKLSTTNLIKIFYDDETRDEYNLIKNLLETTRRSHPLENISEYRIQTIERINNCCLWTKYLNRTWDISKEADPNIHVLFHATVSSEKVVEKGFDERFSNKEGMFGAGVYFAEHSSKSNQYAVGNSFAKPCSPHKRHNCSICIRTMFLCRVTLGIPYKLTSAEKMSHPPPGYHSVEGVPTANGLRYPEFVIYRGEQAYPEYKITYRIFN